MTDKIPLRELTAEVRDFFSYLIVYTPDFPAEDDTSVEKEFRRLLDGLREIHDRVADIPKKRWIGLAIQEVKEAEAAYLSGDERTGNTLLHSAEEHFKNYLEGKRATTTFVVDADGQAKKT